MTCPSMSRDRFILSVLSICGLKLFLEEFQGVTSLRTFLSAQAAWCRNRRMKSKGHSRLHLDA